ncbi:MAG: cytoplasmic protein [Deltaproteobacteria bacterium]
MTTTTTAATTAARCIEAYTRASKHRVELDNSALCGCFFCFRTFATADIKAWIDGAQTALCPKCGIDAVIGSASGYTIDNGFLRQLHTHYFSYRSK